MVYLSGGLTQVVLEKKTIKRMYICMYVCTLCVVDRVSLSSPIKSALIAVRRLLSQFGYRMKTFSARRMSVIQGAQLESYITSLSLNDLNRILFRCDGEERDDGKNFGAYNLAFYGDLKYCGLQGE